MKLPKNLLTVSAFALTLGASSVAAAQTCPPGSWFCADAQVQGSATVNVGGGGLQPLPPPVAGPPPVVVVQPGAPPPAPAPLPPPVVVYQPAPPPVILVQPRPAEYQPTYVRRYAMPYAQHEWGFNLRLDAAAMSAGRANGGGMGGLGAGLRYKLSPYFGVEGGADFVFGTDYNGMSRNETAFTANGLLFLNPKSRAQVYLLGGIGWSVAHVSQDYNYPSTSSFDATYTYFGGTFGLGLEYRASRSIAFNVDVRGFVRGRTDNDAKTNPEFRDPSTGKTTNTSGGALVTAGMTFYF